MTISTKFFQSKVHWWILTIRKFPVHVHATQICCLAPLLSPVTEEVVLVRFPLKKACATNHAESVDGYGCADNKKTEFCEKKKRMSRRERNRKEERN